MKKAILKQLDTASKWLPEVKEKCIITKTGQQLLDEGFKEDKNGVKISRLRFYQIESSRVVNHVEKLKAQYLSGGYPAVEVYLKKYDDHIQKLMAMSKDEAKQKVEA